MHWFRRSGWLPDIVSPPTIAEGRMLVLKRFPSDLNRWDSEEVKDGRVFVHLILLQGAGDAKGLFW